MASKHAKEWWVAQGYAKGHSVHANTEHTVPGRTETKQDQAQRVRIEEEETGTLDIAITRVPTPSSNPARPRTLAYGYDVNTHTLRVDFRDGATYHYYEVTPSEFRDFDNSKSPGKFINRRLAGKAYGRVS